MAVRRMAPDDFQFERTLGTGAFSRVLVARYTPEDKLFAVKIISKRQIMSAPTDEERKRMADVARRESRMLLMCSHPNIIRFHASMQTADDLMYVTELCDGGELLDHIRRRRGIALPAARHLAAETLSAIIYLHHAPKHTYPFVSNAPLKPSCILHRDIKPENIMLTKTKHAKLIDFGTSVVLETTDETATDERGEESKEGSPTPARPTQRKRALTFCGTTHYMSPELLNDSYTCTASDYWALGCVIFHMLAGHRPFEASTPYLLIKKIVEEPLEYPSSFDSTTKDLLSKLLQRDPNQRLGAPSMGGPEAVKKHPFFAFVKDWDTLYQEDVAPLWVYDPEWVKDSDVSSCSGCKKDFSFFLRKHHCRNCGRIFCHSCSTHTSVIPDTTYNSQERVCNSCFEDLSRH